MKKHKKKATAAGEKAPAGEAYEFHLDRKSRKLIFPAINKDEPGWFGSFSEGLPFEVTREGAIALGPMTDLQLVEETIHFANTGELRGGLLALHMRESLIKRGCWNRYVSKCFALGVKPLTEAVDRILRDRGFTEACFKAAP